VNKIIKRVHQYDEWVYFWMIGFGMDRVPQYKDGENMIPTEHESQCALFEWAGRQERRFPELRLMYAIPNGGLRHKKVAADLKAEGVKSGVPDVCLPVARGTWHGLYVEMKRKKTGRVSVSQAGWIEALADQGYRAEVCHSWTDAADLILDYLMSDKYRIEPTIKEAEVIK
jgi:hypothetical protein